MHESSKIDLDPDYAQPKWIHHTETPTVVPFKSDSDAKLWIHHTETPTVVPTKSDSDVILCLQLLSKI